MYQHEILCNNASSMNFKKHEENNNNEDVLNLKL